MGKHIGKKNDVAKSISKEQAKNEGDFIDLGTTDGRTRNFAKVIYPTKAEYEAWYKEHQTYIDFKTGEVATTPHYEGCEGYGVTPENWRDILDGFHIQAFASPLHAMDLNPDGKVKKPHYHILLMFEGKKSVGQANEIFDKICGVGFEVVSSVRGYARYLKHLDNPEKFQYSAPVECFGGADYEEIINLASDDLTALENMIDYITNNKIISYSEFVIYCKNSRRDWFRILAFKGSYFVKEFIKSYSRFLSGKLDE